MNFGRKEKEMGEGVCIARIKEGFFFARLELGGSN